jgi:hypothetical protein
MTTTQEASRFLTKVGVASYRMDDVDLEAVAEVLKKAATPNEVQDYYSAEMEQALSKMAREVAEARLEKAEMRANLLVAQADARKAEDLQELLAHARAKGGVVLYAMADANTFYEKNADLRALLDALGVPAMIVGETLAEGIGSA